MQRIRIRQVQSIGEIEELLLAMEMKLPGGQGPRPAAEAIELFAADPEGVAEVQVPTEDGLEDLVQVGQFRVVGQGNDPDDHRADIAQDGPQGQALESERSSHPGECATIRLPRRPPTL